VLFTFHRAAVIETNGISDPYSVRGFQTTVYHTNTSGFSTALPANNVGYIEHLFSEIMIWPYTTNCVHNRRFGPRCNNNIIYYYIITLKSARASYRTSLSSFFFLVRWSIFSGSCHFSKKYYSSLFLIAYILLLLLFRTRPSGAKVCSPRRSKNIPSKIDYPLCDRPRPIARVRVISEHYTEEHRTHFISKHCSSTGKIYRQFSIIPAREYYRRDDVIRISRERSQFYHLIIRRRSSPVDIYIRYLPSAVVIILFSSPI